MATTLGNGTITFGDGTTLSTASMINSIQRGTFTPSIAVSGGVFNISAVTTAKCMVIIQGDGSYSLGPNWWPEQLFHHIHLDNTICLE